MERMRCVTSKDEDLPRFGYGYSSRWPFEPFLSISPEAPIAVLMTTKSRYRYWRAAGAGHPYPGMR